MILGRGLIGSALQAADREDVLFCASGVSNAYGHIVEECLREEMLLRDNMRQHPDKVVFYFSSYSINDKNDTKNTPYLLHKKRMESLIKNYAKRYVIARTSNVVGRNGQPGNLLNFIYYHLRTVTPFEVWTETSRNVIDVQHLAEMATAYIESYPLNRTIFLVNPVDVKIENIVKTFVQQLHLPANYTLVNKGVYYDCEKRLSQALFEALQISPEGYLEKLIEKYFAPHSIS